ncbi:class C sortase [Schaalia suimastitidis]|uniref:class C sortase n=1 Tax=Schaalia suimastitidis TaxID=121163 RepID=UPI00040FE8FB|nr:class C sortase [Schaalia suimastitidis]
MRGFEKTRAARHRATKDVLIPSPKRNMVLQAVAPLLLVLTGVLVLLYPVLATQHNNAEQQRIAEAFSATVESAGPNVVAEQRARAEHYNATLESEPILDPWLESQRPDTPRYQDYLGQLNLDEVMANIVIPSIHVSLPVYHGTETKTLEQGVGHLFGTSLPIGGSSTHAVLTGHTGLGSATLFDNLIDLKKGDVFYINALGQSLKYEVIDIQVVLPEQTESLKKQAGRDFVTLITCTPYGVNSHRLLVTGERVAIDPIAAAMEQEEAMPAPMQTWQIAILVAVGIIVVAATAITLTLFVASRKKRSVARIGTCSDLGQEESPMTNQDRETSTD